MTSSTTTIIKGVRRKQDSLLCQKNTSIFLESAETYRKIPFSADYSFSIIKSFWRNKCYSMLRFSFSTAVTVTVVAKKVGAQISYNHLNGLAAELIGYRPEYSGP